MDKYICIEKLTLNRLDENEEIDENNFYEVAAGSLWKGERGGMGEVRLEGLDDSENECEWMEISKETLKHNFRRYSEHSDKGGWLVEFKNGEKQIMTEEVYAEYTMGYHPIQTEGRTHKHFFDIKDAIEGNQNVDVLWE